MANPRKDKKDNYGNERKKALSSYNEEDLFRFFRDKFVEVWKANGQKGDINLDEAAREAWKILPLFVLEGVKAAYKLKILKQKIIDKANKELHKKEGKEIKHCKNEKCNKRCSICRKGEQNKKNAVDGDGKEEKKPCGPDKGCGKRDDKKDPPCSDKKKKGIKGKCKNDNDKCREKKGCTSDSNDNPRCGEKKNCGKCGGKKNVGKSPDKKAGKNGGKKKDEAKRVQKKGGGKCADHVDHGEVEMSGSKRKRSHSVQEAYKKMKWSPSSLASSSSSSNGSSTSSSDSYLSSDDGSESS